MSAPSRHPFNGNAKLALITGATRDIDQGVAFALAKWGAAVILAGRDEPKLERVAGEPRSVASSVHVEIVCGAVRELDSPGILANAAGITRRVCHTSDLSWAPSKESMSPS